MKFRQHVFSPNDDGINDYLQIFPTHNLAYLKEIKIFDRWGELLYKQSNLYPSQLTGWDGNNSKGEHAPVGVYVYYIITITNKREEVIFSGDVTLLL